MLWQYILIAFVLLIISLVIVKLNKKNFNIEINKLIQYLGGKENILDLFGGSGSTLIACEQLDKRCFIMELLPEYFDVIIQRWENFTGEKAVKLND